MRKPTSLLLLLVAMALLAQNAFADDARAQEILEKAREAIGGNDTLRKIEGLNIKGQYRRMLGERQMAGEREMNIMLPDKYLVEDAFNPGGMSTALVTTRGLNADKAWTSSSGGGGTMFIRMGGPGGQQATPEQMEAAMRRMYQIELTRYLLALLATPPPSMALDYKYAGESDVDDIKADVVDITGPDKFALRIFFDQKSHIPLLLSYRGPKPRIMTVTRSANQPQNADAIKKARDEAEKQMNSEQAPKPEEADFYIRLSDHKKVSGLLLPFKFTFMTDNDVSEEFEISKYQINPQFKPDKFEKH